MYSDIHHFSFFSPCLLYGDFSLPRNHFWVLLAIFIPKVDHFRTQKKDHMAITENHRTSSEGVGTLTNELVQITEMLDSVKVCWHKC